MNKFLRCFCVLSVIALITFAAVACSDSAEENYSSDGSAAQSEAVTDGGSDKDTESDSVGESESNPEGESDTQINKPNYGGLGKF